MSKPRSTEMRTRQRRKAKLAQLRALFAKAKSQDAKDKLVEKAIKVSPHSQKAELLALWK